MIQFEGYCNTSTLPVKEGDTITLQKGMKYRHSGEDRVVGRKYKIKVHAVHAGMTNTRSYCPEHKHVMNPTIRWVGSGGYWSDMDINEYLNWEPSK